MPLKFATLKSLISDRLSDSWDDAGVWYEPGPLLPDQPVNHVVNLTVDGGIGLLMDGVLDNVSYQVKVTSRQNLYQSGEDLAFAIDSSLLSISSGRYFGTMFSSIYRVGGPPAHFDFDDAERTQFVCSYFFDVESGLPPI
jgi:hypothetical protein